MSKSKPFSRPIFISSNLLDKLGAILLLIALCPLLLAVSICIFLEDGRPLFFRQKRAGKGGKPFLIFKFRSMKRGAERDPRSLFVDEKNPFLTKVGRFIRKWSIDELPQLLNVLKGDMSLVGPRPALLYQVEKYDDFQRRRLLVKPGITGWAQIHGRNELSWEEKIKYDVWYVEHKSFSLDIYILLRTLPVVLKAKGVFGVKIDKIAVPEEKI
jgi:lipopolysaccharide/colanic/teichoic acid biosynthesis glycosyltransferase